MHRTKFSFCPKWTKKNKNGESPIYLRITIDGYRTELSTNTWITPDVWNYKDNNLKNSKENYLQLKGYLETFKGKVYEKVTRLLIESDDITPNQIKDFILGKGKSNATLISMYNQFIGDFALRVEKGELSKSTYDKHLNTEMKITKFLSQCYSKNDILIKELNYDFIKKFDLYLMADYDLKHNSRVKQLKNLKCIVNYYNKVSNKNFKPFSGFATTFKNSGNRYLTSDEVKRIEDKIFTNSRLEQIKDVFLFQCYTGFAFCDLYKLKPEDIINYSGRMCIDTQRLKTEVPCFVPLIDKAIAIIEKYKEKCLNHIVPIKSNQEVNAYLKEIGDLCDIQKAISTHCARHTFGHIAAENGIPLEVIKMILGHTNTNMTSQYCKIDKKQILEQMKKLNSSDDPKKKSNDNENQSSE